MKYTIKDFFESKEMLAIKITTLEDLKKICKAFDRAGIMYSNSRKYNDMVDCFSNCLSLNKNVCLTNGYGYSYEEYYKSKKDFTILTINDIDFEETMAEEPMTIAEYIDYLGYDLTESICAECYKIKHNKTCDEFINWGCEDCEFSKAVNLSNYLNSTYKPKPQIELTEFEKQFLMNLDEKWKWITSTNGHWFYLHTEKPYLDENDDWISNDNSVITMLLIFKQPLFKWEDKEPTSIEMLKEIAKQ